VRACVRVRVLVGARGAAADGAGCAALRHRKGCALAWLCVYVCVCVCAQGVSERAGRYTLHSAQGREGTGWRGAMLCVHTPNGGRSIRQRHPTSGGACRDGVYGTRAGDGAGACGGQGALAGVREVGKSSRCRECVCGPCVCLCTCSPI